MPIVIILLLLILLVLVGFPFGAAAGGLLGGIILLIKEYGVWILIGIIALIVVPIIQAFTESDDKKIKQLDVQIRALENKRNVETNTSKLADIERDIKDFRRLRRHLKQKARQKADANGGDDTTG